jgi:transcriptional regulator with XRE-family HTH domain
MRSRGGTLRAQWLGKLLRDLRESAGLSLKDSGDHLIRDPSTVSRMETGLTPARMQDLRELMNLYGVNDPELRAALEALTRDIWIKDWWDGYARNVHVRVIDLAWLEARAEKLRTFSLPAIHGLLQTREYAEAVMRANDPDASDEQIARWLDFRMKRQEVLDRLDYTAVLDENVFHRPFGGASVMRDQLAHLLDVSDRPNVTIRVLPFSGSSQTGSESSFSLFTMPAPFPLVVQVATDAGAVYIEMPDAAKFEAVYARLEHHALDAEEFRVFIKSRMEQLA